LLQGLGEQTHNTTKECRLPPERDAGARAGKMGDSWQS